MEAAVLVRSLGVEIESSLGPLVAGLRKVALLDYPDFPNGGDSAIWLGQLAWLRSRGLEPVYSADRKRYSEERLRRRLGDGTIVFSGGGNLGDLWEDHQRFREQVVSAFPENRIVVLPQSMHFQRRESLARARAAFDAHPDLTLVLRDRESLERASNAFRAPVRLAPDMAFCLGSLERPRAASQDEVRLLRRDGAGASCGRLVRAPRAGASCDWTQDEPAVLLRAQAWRRARLEAAGAAERLRPGAGRIYLNLGRFDRN